MSRLSLQLVEGSIFDHAITGDIESVKRLLDEENDVNQQNEDGDTILILALKHGHFELANWLIEYGADFTLPDKDEIMPFSIAINSGFFSTARLLLEKKPDYFQKPYKFKIIPPAIIACTLERSLSTAPKGLLKDNSHVGSDGFTALHIAVANNDIESTKILLDHDADINIQESLDFHRIKNEARDFLDKVVNLSNVLMAHAKKGKSRDLEHFKDALHEELDNEVVRLAIKVKNSDRENVDTFASTKPDFMDAIMTRLQGRERSDSVRSSHSSAGSSAHGTPTTGRRRSVTGKTLYAVAGVLRRRSSTFSAGNPESPTSPLSSRRSEVGEVDDDDTRQPPATAAVAIPGRAPRQPRSPGGPSGRGGDDAAHSI